MKYVMLRRGRYRFPVVFPDQVEHSQLSGADVVSAGFCHEGTNGNIAVRGRSVSLNIGPKEGDDAILEAFLTGRESMIFLVQEELPSTHPEPPEPEIKINREGFSPELNSF